jgi:hypothetical protein
MTLPHLILTVLEIYLIVYLLKVIAVSIKETFTKD